jgi:uncharacterized circularly permuted ATP-grasp superfamily protein
VSGPKPRTTEVSDADGRPLPLPGYDPGGFFCELTTERPGDGGALATVLRRLAALPVEELRRRAASAERDLFNLGITFTVYSEATAIDRILPFDIVPRVLTAGEWRTLEAGVKQRVAALNLFLQDIYNGQKILKDGVVPADLVHGNPNYRPEMQGFPVPFGSYVHICGIDIVRDEHGRFRVLEDNARTPSGVSYVIENRHAMLRAFPDLMQGIRLRPVDGYGLRLQEAMCAIAPPAVADPQVVLLSPGIYNSAFFEHVFLAREMGVPLVEGADLTVENDRVFMRTTAGLAPVHTIYRRIDDTFLDPTVFRPDSLLGVPGLIAAWRKGNVALANAVGTGVADDKALYAYMPRIIRYYLAEDPGDRERRDADLPRAGGACRHAGGASQPRHQAGRRIRWLWHHHRPARDPGRARGLPREAARQPGELDQPADDQPLRRPDLDAGRASAAASRPPPLRDHRP